MQVRFTVDAFGKLREGTHQATDGKARRSLWKLNRKTQKGWETGYTHCARFE